MINISEVDRSEIICENVHPFNWLYIPKFKWSVFDNYFNHELKSRYLG